MSDYRAMPRLQELPAHRLGGAIAAVHGRPEHSDLATWAALLCANLQEGRVYLDVRDPLAGLEIVCDVPPLEPAPDWLDVVPDGSDASGLKPLVRTADRLWLARYHDFNCRLKRLIDSRRTQPPLRAMDETRLRSDLAVLFPGAADDEANLGQRLAAVALVDLPFGLLTGGPGTGKTTSLTKLLLLWLRQVGDEDLAPIQLLAPTGKAAARLRQSMADAVSQLDPLTAGRPDWTGPLARLAPEADGGLVRTQTIHRALSVRGSRREDQGPFWHDGRNPLQASVVIVDEVSMVDLALMARLVEAVPPQAPLLLVGDTEQLESVEAGFVLPEIAGGREDLPPDRSRRIAERAGTALSTRGNPNVRTGDHVHLTHVHRYASGSRIGVLAQAVNNGDAEAFLRAVRSDDARAQGIRWFVLPDEGRSLPAGSGLREALLGPDGYGGVSALLAGGETPDAARTVSAFDRFRVLCATRKGPDGVERWNERLQDWIVGPGRKSALRAVMVTANDPVSGLCNGDTGLLLADGGVTRFHSGDHLPMPASRLPATEPAWALTIHKSQGSEYDAVAVVLPREGGGRLLKRRLLYTAVTRARRTLFLVATEAALRQSIATTG